MTEPTDTAACSHPRWVDVLPLDDAPITEVVCVRCGERKPKPATAATFSRCPKCDRLNTSGQKCPCGEPT